MKNDAWFISDLTLRNSYIGLPFLVFFLWSLFGKKSPIQYFFLGMALFFFLLSTVDVVEVFAAKLLPLIGYVRLKGEFRIFSIISIIIVAAIEADQFFKQRQNFGTNIQKILVGLMVVVGLTTIWGLYMAVTQSSFMDVRKEIMQQSSVIDALKMWVDSLSFYDCLWIQGLFHFLILWAMHRSFKTKNLSLLLNWVAIDMIVATLLVMPFTGAGKARLQQVNQMVQTSPAGIPIPTLNPIYLNDTIPAQQEEWIGSWSMFNKQIGSVKEVPYPIQLFKRKAFYADNSKQNQDRYFSRPFLFIKNNDTASLDLKNYTPNKLTITINGAKNGDELIFQQIIYPHWAAYINGKPTRIYLEGNAFMRVPLPAGKSEVILAFEPLLIKKMLWLSAITFGLVTLLLLFLLLKSKSLSPSSR
jgi:hypothetical protein